MGVNVTTHGLMVEHLHLPPYAASMVLIGDLYTRFGNYRRAVDYYRAEGWGQVESMDINGHASVEVDLAQPIEQCWHSAFDVLVNGGTAEHVPNQKQFWKNCDLMMRPGSLMVHVCPEKGSFWEHSQYKYTVRQLRRIARRWDYELLELMRQAVGRKELNWAVYTVWRK